jgi:hypothetical protein
MINGNCTAVLRRAIYARLLWLGERRGIGEERWGFYRRREERQNGRALI